MNERGGVPARHAASCGAPVLPTSVSAKSVDVDRISHSPFTPFVPGLLHTHIAVFAPTNAAFAAAEGTGAATAAQLQDPAFLKPLLQRTLVTGRYLSSNLTTGLTLQTLSGDNLNVAGGAGPCGGGGGRDQGEVGDADSTLQRQTESRHTAGVCVVHEKAYRSMPWDVSDWHLSLVNPDRPPRRRKPYGGWGRRDAV